MTKLLIWGIGGKMGQTLASLIRNDPTAELVGGVDKFASPEDFKYKVFNDYNDVTAPVDAVIDFSRPEALDDILAFGAPRRTPLVLATTGYSEADKARIADYAANAPVFLSANMSLGVNLLMELVKKAAAFLGDGFDIEIVEKHHNQKVDAPSGTALMLADAADAGRNEALTRVYGRHGKSERRQKRDVGIHAVRGGTIVGEHEVLFAGHNELITLSHSAQSKEIFASGAVAAAKFLAGQAPGIYSMSDMLK